MQLNTRHFDLGVSCACTFDAFGFRFEGLQLLLKMLTIRKALAQLEGQKRCSQESYNELQAVQLKAVQDDSRRADRVLV